MKWNKYAYLYQSRTYEHMVTDSLNYTRQQKHQDRMHAMANCLPGVAAVVFFMFTCLLWAAEVI